MEGYMHDVIKQQTDYQSPVTMPSYPLHMVESTACISLCTHSGTVKLSLQVGQEMGQENVEVEWVHK